MPLKSKPKMGSMQIRRRRSSTSSAGGFGIEPALHAAFNEFSHTIKHNFFKDNSMSTEIDNEDCSNSCGK